jgi:ABC-type antimicrobial peptide transport system permease subunit
MVCAGLVAGACMVFWAKPLAAAVLHDLKFESVTPLGVGAAAILGVALLASYLPVRRAARVDPMLAFRHD